MQTRLPQRLRDALSERFDQKLGQRTTGIVLAIGLELLLVVLLFTLSQSEPKPTAPVVSISTFDASSEDPAEDPAEEEVQEQADPEPDTASAPIEAVEPPPEEPVPPVDPEPVTAPPAPPRAVLIPLDRGALAKADITPKAPPAPAPAQPSPSYGPSFSGNSRGADTQQVGTAPNGQPMYAARWFREPRDDELSGYLSTADGPGWGLIACQTAPQYRVENCEIIAESPRGSNIARSAKAAAWQFQVRPPRIGGVSQVGTWVRIRIDYTRGVRSR